MRIDLPMAALLVARGGDLLLIAEACAIGAVDLGAGKGFEGEPHHDHVDADHDAKEREQHQEDLGSGQRLRRGTRCHARSPPDVTAPRNWRLRAPLRPAPYR